MSYHTLQKKINFICAPFGHFETNTFTCYEKFPLRLSSWAEICGGGGEFLPKKIFFFIIFRAII